MTDEVYDLLPMCIPKCPTGLHGDTVLCESQDPGVRWCGVWYRCPVKNCGASVLFRSKELEKSLQEQRISFDAQ